jgi:plasmid stabilization system protein ParE
MTATVEFSDNARRMLDDADERSVAEHGYFVANPLVDEAEHAIELLRGNPELGARFRGALGRQPEIRRLLLQTGWHLYYCVDASRTHVLILAVWYAGRGRPPSL